jgi:hypothetical protein
VQFRDAGKDYGYSGLTVDTVKPPEKYYSSLDIDLDKFPELSADIGEECVFVVRGIVKRKSLDESSKCQTIEVRGIASSYAAEEKESRLINEADQALSDLKSNTKRY